ncbi:MAG: potassium ABC transporter ATPase [Ideonella sp.]|nr:potassium ABC transporter ATPase [Ideonella sp.]MBL0147377.1 potassium ABC transporter ATPase [Ideonella sp.]
MDMLYLLGIALMLMVIIGLVLGCDKLGVRK